MKEIRPQNTIELYQGGILKETFEGSEVLDMGMTADEFFMSRSEIYRPLRMVVKQKNGSHPNGNQKYKIVFKLDSSDMIAKQNYGGLSGLQHSYQQRPSAELLAYKNQHLDDLNKELKREIDKLKESLDKKLKKLKEYENEIREFRHASEIEEAKGGGLSGLMEKPEVVEKLLDGVLGFIANKTTVSAEQPKEVSTNEPSISSDYMDLDQTTQMYVKAVIILLKNGDKSLLPIIKDHYDQFKNQTENNTEYAES